MCIIYCNKNSTICSFLKRKKTHTLEILSIRILYSCISFSTGLFILGPTEWAQCFCLIQWFQPSYREQVYKTKRQKKIVRCSKIFVWYIQNFFFHFFWATVYQKIWIGQSLFNRNTHRGNKPVFYWFTSRKNQPFVRKNKNNHKALHRVWFFNGQFRWENDFSFVNWYVHHQSKCYWKTHSFMYLKQQQNQKQKKTCQSTKISQMSVDWAWNWSNQL